MMQGYRIYLLSNDGSISQRVEFLASDDEVAIERAKEAAVFLEAELWHSSRLVCTFPVASPN